MEKGRPKSGITLTEREREQLETMATQAGQPAHLAARARIILRSVEGDSNTTIAQGMGLTQATVGKWRRRFASYRVVGLYDNMRPGKPRTIDDRQLQTIAAITTAATASGDAAPDSVRALAARTGMSKSSVARYLQLLGKTRSRPHFALFSDPLLLEQLQAPAALYLSGSDRALVICLDTKSPLSLPLPARPAHPMPSPTMAVGRIRSQRRCARHSAAPAQARQRSASPVSGTRSFWSSCVKSKPCCRLIWMCIASSTPAR